MDINNIKILSITLSPSTTMGEIQDLKEHFESYFGCRFKCKIDFKCSIASFVEMLSLV